LNSNVPAVDVIAPTHVGLTGHGGVAAASKKCFLSNHSTNAPTPQKGSIGLTGSIGIFP